MIGPEPAEEWVRGKTMAEPYTHPSIEGITPRVTQITDKTLFSIPMVLAIISLTASVTQMFVKSDATAIKVEELKADFKEFKKDIKEDLKVLNINQLRLENAVKHGR